VFDPATFAKFAADFGGLGIAGIVIAFAGYGLLSVVKLAKEFAPQFISAQANQTAAIQTLARNISESQQKQAEAIGDTAKALRSVVEDQREVLIVMRSISNELRELREESRGADVEMRSAFAQLRSSVEGAA